MKLASLLLLSALVLGTPAACRGQGGQAPGEMTQMDSTEMPASTAAHEAMSGAMVEDLHMRMTARRAGTAADSERAAELVSQIRKDLDKYRDVRVAQADGYRQFLPGVKQPVYHFTSWRRAIEASFRFDVASPTSLLYRATPDGRFELVGAMYTAPARTSADELDRRIPLGIARWHEHVNWCLPPRGATARWREQKDGLPAFGPKSPIATAAACDSVGGRFFPRVFGWMVHVQAFASDDPKVIWSVGHHEEHSPP